MIDNIILQTLKHTVKNKIIVVDHNVVKTINATKRINQYSIDGQFGNSGDTMSQPMSETLDRATPRHLINMINVLCKDNGREAPELAYHHLRKRWLTDNYNSSQINWADQQVKEDFRQKGIPYKAIEGRGRPVGAKNKNKAGVSSDYFDKLLGNDKPTIQYSTSTPYDFSPPIEEKNPTVVDPKNIPTDLSDIINKLDVRIDRLQIDVHNLSTHINTDIKRDITSINVNMGELRETVNGVSHHITNLQDKLNSIIENRPTIVELKQPNDLPNISAGIQHMNFPDLLIAANSILPNGNHPNIWLAGPAGTGKTTAAEKLAELLGLEFRYNGALSNKFELVGYMDANGRYVATAFRETWEHGGVYLFDEIDGSMPDALLSMNGALANSIASFPDKMVHRHKDCIIIAGANTMGLGGGTEYVGAMKQNAAFLNRFEYIEWPHDNALEDALCPNKEWLARVREIRARVVTKQIKSHLITMRASIFGASLLNAGMPWDKVERMTLKCGMTDAHWGMVK